MLQPPNKAGGSPVMTVEASPRSRYKLADLMAEMPEGLPCVEGWDEMPSLGLEKSDAVPAEPWRHRASQAPR